MIKLDAAQKPSKSQSLFAAAQQSLPSGYARHMAVNKPYPFYIDKAKGCWTWDVDGAKRIDFTNNFTSLIHGHAHPEIAHTIAVQAERVTCSTMPSEWEAKLADLLANRVAGIEQVRFTNSGTEAIMIAVKLARAITGKSMVAKVEGGYHGQYDLIEASFQPSPDKWGPRERPNVVPHNEGTPESLASELLVLPLNDIDATAALLREYGDKLSAILIDPLRTHLGYIKPHRDYIEMLRELATENNCLLIFDEIVALRDGFNGRQGKLGVFPDITAVGKIIGGGLPIGGVGASREIMSAFDADKPRVKHSGTFTANPMSLAAGHTAMTLLDEDAYARLESLTNLLAEGLQAAMQSANIDGEVDTYSSAARLLLQRRTINDYRDLKQYFDDIGTDSLLDIQRLFMEEGVIATRCGFVLSTAMTEQDIEFTVDAAGRVFRRFNS